MSEYDLNIRVPASVKDVYDYVSNLNNLAEYMPRITAIPGETTSGTITIEAFSGGEARSGEARYTANDGDYKLEWSAADHDRYSGSLEIKADGDTSIVNLCLKTTLPHQEDIRAGIMATLGAIKSRFAGAGPIES